MSVQAEMDQSEKGNKVANVQGGCGGVDASVHGLRFCGQGLFELGLVGHILDESPFGELLKQRCCVYRPAAAFY